MNCQRCSSQSELFNIRIGRGGYRVCGDCFDAVMNRAASEGAEELAPLLFSNFTEETTFDIMARFVASGVLSQEDASSKIAKYMEMMPMFTYGILKYPSNISNEGGVNIVTNATVRGHQMFLYNESFPITKKTKAFDKDIVYGTYFEVPTHIVLCRYDHVEGYDPTRPESENMYNRVQVPVQMYDGNVMKMANMYIANPAYFLEDMKSQFRIYSGNFDDRHLAGVRPK